MATTEPRDRAPVLAARTVAGRFRTAAASTGRGPGRGDDLRRYRAAQRTLQPRDQRFAHLKRAHD